MTFQHLIDLNDFSVQQWNRIIDLAIEIKQNPVAYARTCRHKMIATMFLEPSTRTQMSFQTAMLKLGGQYIALQDPVTSSMAKGESLADTIRMLSDYADILAIRHPNEGAAKAAALYANCPVINAGDGAHLHPTQTLTDLITLKSEKGQLTGLTIGICGDLKYGRTVHSFIRALSLYPDNRFVLISTPQLRVPSYIQAWLEQQGCSYLETVSLDQGIEQLDVLYMTRIQKERFASEQAYMMQKDQYILSAKKLESAKKDVCIMHPFPRLYEIDLAVDNDPRAAYFKQASFGTYARMALIITLLQAQSCSMGLQGYTRAIPCQNKQCITNLETYLPKSYTERGGVLVCEFCDARQILE